MAPCNDSAFNENVCSKLSNNPGIGVKINKNLDRDVLKIFDLKNSMNSKKSYGGTAEANVKMMIKKID